MTLNTDHTLQRPKVAKVPTFTTTRQLANWLTLHANTFARSSVTRDEKHSTPEYLDGLHDAYSSSACFVHSLANAEPAYKLVGYQWRYASKLPDGTRTSWHECGKDTYDNLLVNSQGYEVREVFAKVEK